MKDFLDNIREVDKRIGVPEFKGWKEREIEAYKKAQSEISILKDNAVKYTRYYIFDKPKHFIIPSDYPMFFEGDKINKRPLEQAKRFLKRDGFEILKVYKNGKWFEYTL